MKRITLVAIIGAIVFGAASAAFGLLSPIIWNSPDETAVAFFAQRLASAGHLWSLEPYNFISEAMVHPRSIIVIDDFLVPGSFYGAIFFFAFLLKILGPVAYSIGTPLLTAIASVCVFFVLVRIFDRPRALIGLFLFLSHPIVWYFTNRGLYPNVIFLDLVVIGLSILYLRPWHSFVKERGNRILGTLIDDTIGILFIGSAFLVRPVEFIWLAPILIVWLWFVRKNLTWLRLAVALILAALFIATLLFTNSSLYGGVFNSGYTAGSTAPGVSVPALSQTSRLPSFISSPRPFILPFGFHPRAVITNLWNYLVLFQWWLPVFALVGFLLTKEKVFRRRFGRAFWWVVAVVGVYYGSGVFLDSSVSQWTIGSSYMRYFLPASVLLVPFASEGIWILAKKAKKYSALVAVVLVSGFVVLGAWTVYFRSPESLIPMRAELNRYEMIKKSVLTETTVNDIIITERSDKIFFPERKIVLNLRDQATLDSLPRFAIFAGIYYFGITIAEEEYPKIQQELHNRGLQMGRIKSFGNETLYGITREISNN